MLKIKELLKNKKTTSLLIALGFIGIALIFISDLGKKNTATGTENSSSITDSEYIKNTENNIKNLVCKIVGNTDVTVAITLENGREYVYATTRNSDTAQKTGKTTGENYNSEVSDKSEESYIIINNGSCEQPLLISTTEPTVRGVVIVCNTQNEATVNKIKNAVCTLLGITKSSVNITTQLN